MAFDDDNTGALDHYEFFLGLRAMNGYSADAEHIDRFAFTFFNTELLDGERDDVINVKEIEGFLLSFYSEACDLAASNLHQFENIFGPSVASVAVRGLPNRVPWAESDAKASIDQASLEGARENAQLFATRLVGWAPRGGLPWRHAAVCWHAWWTRC